MTSPAVRAWLGLPFAALAHPFAAPERIAPPIAPLPGGSFGPAPAQRPVEGFDLTSGQSTTDCLTVNVWAPKDAANAPVAVWLFGGGFEMGTASTPWFDGAALAAASDSVVVTVNYRVGAFGFGHFHRPGGPLADAHDLGLRDVIAALHWVDAAAETFGGDPARVTLIGQSAGAFLAAAAAVAPDVPRPRALACFSGGASRIVAEPDATDFADAILAELGILGEPQRLLDLDPDRILAAQAAVAPRDLAVRNGHRPVGFGVAVDAAAGSPVVPRHPLDAIAAGALVDTFVLVAAGTDEMAGFGAGVVPALSGSLGDALERLAGTSPAAVSDAYAGEDADCEWIRLLGDYIYRLPAARLAAAQAAAGGGASYLEVGRTGDEPGGHGAELPGIFARGGDERTHAVTDAVVALIRDGRVGGDLAAPLSAGEIPAESIAPADLLRVWEGVARP
ncbi:carboxylesterase family protein [Microbacterium sp. KSW4-11]|uniref:Carboxylic ester hydrolase n=1 Tax=Microbacterium gawkjiense TaxID=3067309 RepID=A0ABU3G9M3_9MICO|nr:carboxylesterase family protein [Microbacterium sp. KSW4-11]MDT3316220.1 carboxylesterase family protein [Microbacterium sp. KSW4-11]